MESQNLIWWCLMSPLSNSAAGIPVLLWLWWLEGTAQTAQRGKSKIIMRRTHFTQRANRLCFWRRLCLLQPAPESATERRTTPIVSPQLETRDERRSMWTKQAADVWFRFHGALMQWHAQTLTMRQMNKETSIFLLHVWKQRDHKLALSAGRLIEAQLWLSPSGGSLLRGLP